MPRPRYPRQDVDGHIIALGRDGLDGECILLDGSTDEAAA
jgi:hypothetical protein